MGRHYDPCFCLVDENHGQVIYIPLQPISSKLPLIFDTCHWKFHFQQSNWLKNILWRYSPFPSLALIRGLSSPACFLIFPLWRQSGSGTLNGYEREWVLELWKLGFKERCGNGVDDWHEGVLGLWIPSGRMRTLFNVGKPSYLLCFNICTNQEKLAGTCGRASAQVFLEVQPAHFLLYLMPRCVGHNSLLNWVFVIHIKYLFYHL